MPGSPRSNEGIRFAVMYVKVRCVACVTIVEGGKSRKICSGFGSTGKDLFADQGKGGVANY